MADRNAQAGVTVLVVLAIVALLGGLVLGPGQIAWCVFLSGEKGETYECQPDREVVVPLTPEQNPVRFLATLEYREPRMHFGRAVTAYDAVLRLGDEQLWASRFRVSHEDDDERTGITIGSSYVSTPVQLFSVEEPGDYTFVAKSTSDKDIEVHSIRLRIRQNVSEVHTASAVAGFVMLALAIVLVVVAVRSSRQQAASKS